MYKVCTSYLMHEAFTKKKEIIMTQNIKSTEASVVLAKIKDEKENKKHLRLKKVAIFSFILFIKIISV